MAVARTNWAGNIIFAARRFHEPTSLAGLRGILAEAAGATAGGGRVRVLGTGHSFSPVADTDGDQLGLSRMPAVRELDTVRGLARVSAGLRYGEVAPWLHDHGFALHNLGSLPHIAVAGACATGTHGSGDTNPVLASAVRSLELVTVAGDVVELSPDGAGPGCGPEFAGAVVALGTLGVVTAMTLDLEPSYDVAQTVYDDLPVDAAIEHLDAILGAAYSVSLCHRWQGDTVDTVWLKRRDGEAPADVFGARPADGPRNPVRGQPTDAATEQAGRPGPWHRRLPHFRLDFTPSAGEEIQSEFFVPRERAAQALVALREIQDVVAPLLLVCEIRSVAADELWLSGAYGRDSVALHFTWVRDTAAVAPVVARVEERLLPFGARPHWGKLFTAPPDVVRPLFPRLDDARRLAATFDPKSLLSNAFVDAYLLG
jgi:xylitol oxidase